MAKDWDAVARAIQARLAELEMTQQELAHRAGVALMTVRELQRNLKPRRRSPRTLAAISEALGFNADHLSKVLAGNTPTEPETEAGDPVLKDLESMKQQLTTITERLDAIERRLADDDGNA